MQNNFEQAIINNLDNMDAMKKLALSVAESKLYALDFFDCQIFGLVTRN
jgi:hypothetical protein